eukprot:TRINITY_DN4475_c0_g1_i2.p1 TRINITY_DN4475_c0_g1~~TRINITY_DN4475_c0_g1_i2.p1  ORF type:complete len:270 (-),score=49.18 TRINITY_DN4475_c0_g1_i2:87-896(-)
MTEYVATRWYRAPEILLGSQSYTKGVDMWSIGCILGELLGGKPMFPGTSTMNQLTRIVEITGRPSKEDMASIKSDFAATMMESLPQPKKRCLAELFPHASKDALDLLSKLLQFNPTKRLSAEEAVNHPYVVQFLDEDEPVCAGPISIPIDDNTKYSIQDYRNKLYSDIKAKKREQKKKLVEMKQQKKKKRKAVRSGSRENLRASRDAPKTSHKTQETAPKTKEPAKEGKASVKTSKESKPDDKGLRASRSKKEKSTKKGEKKKKGSKKK